MLAIISASRRTDLPRMFPGQLAEWLATGRVAVKNPFNRIVRTVLLAPENVHTLVLWSKDFSRLLQNAHELRTQVERFSQVYYHFSVTGLGGTPWEPGVLSADAAGAQFKPLVRLAGNPLRVNWRFDPVVFWREGETMKSNVRFFQKLAPIAAEAGITTVTISLCQWYQKSRRRAAAYGISWVEPGPETLAEAAGLIQQEARAQGLKVSACCSPSLMSLGIDTARCIDGNLLSSLHPQGQPAETGKDTGQRKHCGCTPSSDIGDYDLACEQGCVYCYANPITNKTTG